MTNAPDRIVSCGAEDLEIPPELDRTKRIAQPSAPSINLPGLAEPTRANSRTIDEWAAYISEPYYGSLKQILQTGTRLIEAKQELLLHGQFESMVREKLPFSTSTARKLMRIAGHAIISNRSTWTDLPASWTVLADLAQLPQDTFEKMRKEGAINPNMTKSNAESLVWQDKVRRGVKLKKISAATPSKVAARLKRSSPPCPSLPQPQPLPPTAPEELLALAVRVATELRTWPTNIAAGVRQMPVEDRQQLGISANEIIGWWLGIYNATQP